MAMETGDDSPGYLDRDLSGDETESDDREDSSGEDEFEFDLGEGYVPKKKTKRIQTPGMNGGLPNYTGGLYDKDYWHCTNVGQGGGGQFVKMVDTVFGGAYNVPAARVNKALRFLHMPTCAATISACAVNCRCKRIPQCYQRGLTTNDVLNQRHIFFQQINECDATKYLASLVRPHNHDHDKDSVTSTPEGTATPSSSARRKYKWVVLGVEMCDDFFRAVFGISKDKLKGVRLLLQGAGTLPAPRTRVENPKVKYHQCKAFWRGFFKLCQRPNAHTRLFPANISYPCVYEDYFSPWFKKTLPDSADDMPCLGWLMAARRDDEFKDVKNRAKHFHCRCQECANLQARRLKAFNSVFEQEEYKREFQDHEREKLGWRDFEQGRILRAKHNPREYQVLWFDDTESMGLPKFTKRPMKNLPVARFEIIPFLIADLARGKDWYIYTAKNRFRKGANRLCTSLHTVLGASKEGPQEARHARWLTLIADNFAENKNNTLFAYCSDLVSRGWYDVVELIYGPTGHTHNGGDQQHQIHNEVLGNFTSLTMPHLLARYPQAWRQVHTRPTPCILDVQYDWDGYYAPFINKIAGHTNTTTDPVAIRGLKFARGADGVVEMQWKTKAESGEWRGADNQMKTPGFVVLKGRAQGKPGLIEPKRDVMKNKYYKQLLGGKMTTCVEAEGSTEAMAWLAKAAKHVRRCPGAPAPTTTRTAHTWRARRQRRVEVRRDHGCRAAHRG